ncbi:hypothetical protein BDQ17DRAFT_1321878 [Cyathus striatus]|nr:hypothetical protein BDQ17DRAFT_1321878 [Cyathus striatus]
MSQLEDQANVFDIDESSSLSSDDDPKKSSWRKNILHSPRVIALEDGDWFLWAVSVALLSVFLLEIFASLFAFGPRRFLKPLYAIDAVIIIASFILEIYFRFADGNKQAGSSPAALVILRLWKVIRAIHAVAHSIELKNQSIIHEVREAKQQVEEEHKETTILLQRDQAKIVYLRSRLPDVTDAELEQQATLEMERLKSALRKEEEAGYGSDDHN